MRGRCSECWVDSDHLSKGEPLWRFCVSDEHYIPTLLAFSAAEHETDCQVLPASVSFPLRYYGSMGMYSHCETLPAVSTVVKCPVVQFLGIAAVVSYVGIQTGCHHL